RPFARTDLTLLFGTCREPRPTRPLDERLREHRAHRRRGDRALGDASDSLHHVVLGPGATGAVEGLPMVPVEPRRPEEHPLVDRAGPPVGRELRSRRRPRYADVRRGLPGPIRFTGTLDKLTIAIDRPHLTP